MLLQSVLHAQGGEQAPRVERCHTSRWGSTCPSHAAEAAGLGTRQGQTDTRPGIGRNNHFCFQEVSTPWKSSPFKEAAILYVRSRPGHTIPSVTALPLSPPRLMESVTANKTWCVHTLEYLSAKIEKGSIAICYNIHGPQKLHAK